MDQKSSAPDAVSVGAPLRAAPDVGHAPPVGPVLRGMRKRREFLMAASALRQSAGSFMVQARKRGDAEYDGRGPLGSETIRVGFTCSKKVGNAVARNRAKRRLRALAQIVLPQAALPGWDYVLIGRFERTAAADFAQMQQDLAQALRRLHGAKPETPKAPDPTPEPTSVTP